jgi:hypothetical protein
VDFKEDMESVVVDKVKYVESIDERFSVQGPSDGGILWLDLSL